MYCMSPNCQSRIYGEAFSPADLRRFDQDIGPYIALRTFSPALSSFARFVIILRSLSIYGLAITHLLGSKHLSWDSLRHMKLKQCV
ncbi:hypothetical protein GQ43DRAFT_132741 [Delitschia confertaspora ATCC 74209]|uniref:Uncharacterized protein n=1 Tax=Delitschia confertaspora ATCC 74209 TaxID=1513339 RepID=A0A9P4JJ70_9PLEO|nr:hypothetical protein GQ43DRAFT_132741 [Delitschia confertaspora ATCC 74209]